MAINLKTIVLENEAGYFCGIDCPRKMKKGVLQCKCGEQSTEWCWGWSGTPGNNVVLSHNNKITFHPVYSSGTAVIRGNDPLESNNHYYWEIKICSTLYGTDVMLGVGTRKVSLIDTQFRFCSLLGCDDQSWGYSYHGLAQHNGCLKKYGKPYGIGSIIGVHADMYLGTLQFYVNREPLGLAYTNLKGKEIYPMISSTAAHSVIKLNCAFKETTSLQLRCLQAIQNDPKVIESFKNVPGLRNLVKKSYFWLIPKEDELEKDHPAAVERAKIDKEALQTVYNRLKRHPAADPDHLSYRKYLFARVEAESQRLARCRRLCCSIYTENPRVCDVGCNDPDPNADMAERIQMNKILRGAQFISYHSSDDDNSDFKYFNVSCGVEHNKGKKLEEDDEVP